MFLEGQKLPLCVHHQPQFKTVACMVVKLHKLHAEGINSLLYSGPLFLQDCYTNVTPKSLKWSQKCGQNR